MIGLLIAAIPAFVLLMLAEALSYRHLAQEAREDHVGYETRDARTSILMGAGSLVTSGVWNIVALAVYAGIFLLSPLKIPMDTWWSWLLLLVLFDLLFYFNHRFHHVVRIGWASHVVHHSSRHFNLSTAVRQPWTPFTTAIFFAPLPLMGFSPAAVALMSALDLLYQFWIHTERINRLPRPIEWLFNTPSHHRAHHGSDAIYLDKNYGGILIIWDRLFGTFQPELQRPNYGLTKNLETFNPLHVAFHEWAAIGHDVRAANSWRDRLGYAFGRPGWTPAASPAAASGSTHQSETAPPVPETGSPVGMPPRAA